MYTWEIKQLMELKEYLISVKEYINVLSTSPQIKEVRYDPFNDSFFIETDDNYRVNFRIYKEV